MFTNINLYNISNYDIFPLSRIPQLHHLGLLLYPAVFIFRSPVCYARYANERQNTQDSCQI